MGDESGIEPRNNSTVTALGARVTALESRATGDEARITALESVPGASAQNYTCPSGATVRQLVYKTSVANAADLADASDPTKMPALGFIASKPSSTSCVLQDEDELAGFVGLTTDARYYADPAVPGGITSTLPDVLAGQVVQQVGTAKSTTVLKVEISTPAPVNP